MSQSVSRQFCYVSAGASVIAVWVRVSVSQRFGGAEWGCLSVSHSGLGMCSCVSHSGLGMCSCVSHSGLGMCSCVSHSGLGMCSRVFHSGLGMCPNISHLCPNMSLTLVRHLSHCASQMFWLVSQRLSLKAMCSAMCSSVLRRERSWSAFQCFLLSRVPAFLTFPRSRVSYFSAFPRFLLSRVPAFPTFQRFLLSRVPAFPTFPCSNVSYFPAFLRFLLSRVPAFPTFPCSNVSYFLAFQCFLRLLLTEILVLVPSSPVFSRLALN